MHPKKLNFFESMHISTSILYAHTIAWHKGIFLSLSFFLFTAACRKLLKYSSHLCNYVELKWMKKICTLEWEWVSVHVCEENNCFNLGGEKLHVSYLFAVYTFISYVHERYRMNIKLKKKTVQLSNIHE